MRDNGPGITARAERCIFDPFYTTKAKGTGLGMAIARRIVEAHGGRIAVGEPSGPGATIFSSPYREDDHEHPLSRSPSPTTSSTCATISSRSCRCWATGRRRRPDGRELVEHCRTARPDLVITDIKMPDMDGIDAAAEIYAQAPIPVILVSAYHDPEFIRRAEADHILAYLVKPIKQADLEPAIGIAMRRFEQFQALRKETADLKQALEDRKVIEQAKGILMKKAGLDEPEAFPPAPEAGQRQEPQADRDRPDDYSGRASLPTRSSLSPTALQIPSWLGWTQYTT